MKISNITLAVRSAEASSGFYKKLGFRIVHAEGAKAIMSLGSSEIVLVERADVGGKKGHGVTIYISADNADAAFMELAKKGVAATVPQDVAPGTREFTVTDPDGYQLCFSAPLADWS